MILLFLLVFGAYDIQALGSTQPAVGHDAAVAPASHARTALCIQHHRGPVTERISCGFSGVSHVECATLGCCWFEGEEPRCQLPAAPSSSTTSHTTGSDSSDSDSGSTSGSISASSSEHAASRGYTPEPPGEVTLAEAQAAEDVMGAPAACAVAVPEAERTDCGYVGVSQGECEGKGCCWSPTQSQGAPWCFQPLGGGYRVTGVATEPGGGFMSVDMHIDTPQLPSLGPDYPDLTAEITHESMSRLHVKIKPPGTASRWEVPDDLIPRPGRSHQPAGPQGALYTVTAPQEGQPFELVVGRHGGGAGATPVFDSRGHSLVFKPQYLEVSTALAPGATLYGLGERTLRSGDLRLPRDGRRVALWAEDMASYNADVNLYGAHPFYMSVDPDGTSHGVFLLNSNAIEVALNPASLTFRVLGGVLDLYFFLGPTPEEVLSQYQEVIGRPAMPPYWALGFHQCRWGYHSVGELREVVAGYSQAAIPLEVIWSDIDWMDRYRNFVPDPVNYPPGEMAAFLTSLYAAGQHWVPIVDAGIPQQPGYIGYDTAMQADVFITGADGQPYLGQVWPGPSHFPDFLHPDTRTWWYQRLSQMFRELGGQPEGVWIDMNEPSNFCGGAICKRRAPSDNPAAPDSGGSHRNASGATSRATATAATTGGARPPSIGRRQWQVRRLLAADAAPAGGPSPPASGTRASKVQQAAGDADTAAAGWGVQPSAVGARSPLWEDLTNCRLDCQSPGGNDPLNSPPYHIGNSNGAPLWSKTLSMDARGKGGEAHYDTHNLYGFSEARATHEALRAAGAPRPFVLSRSTFPGSGQYAAHWTGDNGASWDNLRWSVQGLLNSNLWGITLAGSDICGFSGDTNEELCARWISAGAFYTFSRNHNTIGAAPQELYRWPSVAAAARTALGLRYRLLPYLYTSHYAATAWGGSVAKPVFFADPGDATARAVSTQWLLGWSLLVSPVLEQGVSTLSAYFPRGRWYPLNGLVSVGGLGDIGDTSATGDFGGTDGDDVINGPATRQLSAPVGAIPLHIRGGGVLPLQHSANTTVRARATPVTLLLALPRPGAPAGEGLPPSCSERAEQRRDQATAGGGVNASDSLMACGLLYLDSGDDPEVGGPGSVLVWYTSVASVDGSTGGLWGDAERPPAQSAGDAAKDAAEGLVYEEIVLAGLPAPVVDGARAWGMGGTSAVPGSTVAAPAEASTRNDGIISHKQGKAVQHVPATDSVSPFSVSIGPSPGQAVPQEKLAWDAAQGVLRIRDLRLCVGQSLQLNWQPLPPA